jgi:hypothetical protein
MFSVPTYQSLIEAAPLGRSFFVRLLSDLDQTDLVGIKSEPKSACRVQWIVVAIVGPAIV